MKKADYKIEKHGRFYMGIACGDHVLLATDGKATDYTGAREMLGKMAQKAGVKLEWFQGEHVCECCK